jgi:nucleoside phosphorylase
MTGNSDDLPVLWDTTNAPSAFDPADWFRYCEAITGRQRPTLPPFGIQSVIPAHLQLVCDRYGAKIDDFTLADHPFAVFEHEGTPMVLGFSAKGSYAAGGLDEMIALGARHIVFLGGCAALVHQVAVDDLIIPTQALRDEGVSFHYIPPSRYVYPSKTLTATLLSLRDSSPRRVHAGPIWTTTAHFRQALPRLHAFRDEGCVAVNNEGSSAFAVGQARGVDVAAVLNAGDTLADDRFVVPAGHPKLYQPADAADQFDLALAALAAFARRG